MQKPNPTPTTEQLLIQKDAQIGILKLAIHALLDVPMWVDEATVAKAGIEAAPGQVVFNASIAYWRVKQVQDMIANIEQVGMDMPYDRAVLNLMEYGIIIGVNINREEARGRRWEITYLDADATEHSLWCEELRQGLRAIWMWAVENKQSPEMALKELQQQRGNS